jgi:erythromycin esterase-like protein
MLARWIWRSMVSGCMLLLFTARASAQQPPLPDTAPQGGESESENDLARSLRQIAQPLSTLDTQNDALMNLVGDARIVMIGEASHGTHEFYDMRARITQQLIEQKGFNAVAIEGNWTDAYPVNQFVHGAGAADAEASLSGFEEFPLWMWRNEVVRDFITWLRQHNTTSSGESVGFYGLDLYGVYESIDAVIEYLESVDPEAAAEARAVYACFQGYGDNPQMYGMTVASLPQQSCEDEAQEQLEELEARAEAAPDEQAHFVAEQNARVIANGEEYYRAMFQGGVSTWNLRDQHMADTLDALITHLETQGKEAKIVVWAHNSHVGDARATSMGQGGEVNIGQLMRERYGDDVRLIGFSTYTGTVSAADNWGEPHEVKQVRPGLPESYELLFHQVGEPEFLLPLRDNPSVHTLLNKPRLQRAIGVIYRPQTERWSHYFDVDLPRQFDAIIHIDETTALKALDNVVREVTPELFEE